jgi:hypothetical protein
MKIAGKIKAVLASRKFFWAVIIFLVIEGLWIAFSAMYPMAFDEDFHFGIIKIYSEHLLPFLPGQPENASQFAAVARDPSFLYHYLMSFPYRLIAAITDSQAAQIIFLRIINVCMFAGSLLLFARLFKKVGTSPALANTALALFVLIPIVPLLAGQINYDNLFMVCTALLLLLGVSALDQLKNHKLDLKTVSWLVIVCMLGCMTKYAFLPLAGCAVIFLTVYGYLHNKHSGKKLLASLGDTHNAMGNASKLGIMALFIVSLVIFVQRYGINIIQYHTPLPDCAAVLSVEECNKYGPWERNHRFSLTKEGLETNSAWYLYEWNRGMVMRLFFMVNGPLRGYNNYVPVPIPTKTFLVIAVAAIITTFVYARKIFGKSPKMMMLLVVSLGYVLVLFVNNYTDYMQTARPVAINGRYLLPVFLPLAAVAGVGFALALRKKTSVKPWLAAAAILLFLQGGGIFSFILRSDTSWYWPNNTAVEHFNNGARKVLDPFIFQGPRLGNS